MNRQPYSSDVADAQWAILEPLLPVPDPEGRPLEIERREIVNAIFYVLRSGCPWRYLPHDLPWWLKVEGGKMSVIRQSYSAEFKTKVVREILREEKTLSQIASEYGTHVNGISRWRDQALAALPGAFNDQAKADQVDKEAAWEKEREELHAEIGKLSTQLTFLKKKCGHLLEPR